MDRKVNVKSTDMTQEMADGAIETAKRVSWSATLTHVM